MTYGEVIAYRHGSKLMIEIQLPERGIPSESGRADNLVDPRRWIDVDDEGDHLGIKMTVCRPLCRRRRNGSRSGRRTT